MEKYLQLIREGFAKEIDPCKDPEMQEEWARFGIFVAHHLYQMIRKWRFRIDAIDEAEKADGSPTTALELEMEHFAKSALERFHAPAQFLGEESGGDADTSGFLFVIDPIDGTRSFLSGFETYSITLSVLKNRVPLFSLVCVPSSSDVYFRIGSGQSMLFQIPTADQPLEVYKMPLFQRSEDQPILVNLHPSVESLPYLERLFDLWYQGDISLLKSVSGSPSLLMVEAAKTGTFYVNSWKTGPPRPYDLIPALHIVEASNCLALRRDGEQVDVWNHQGVYIVGPRGKRLDMLLKTMPYLH